ncbi:MAG: shikimate kinase [Nitrospirota bacterium]|nr:MAG: shikimate kinase [Nitrospirota bacterium]
MKNIVLTGFMGAGKTSVARELSSRLGMKIVDMDDEIEKEQGMTINDIFARFGEERFRELESEMAKKVSGLSGAVISTGGGIVLRKENITHLRTNGHVVCLMVSPEAVLKRTSGSDVRPLLNVNDPLGKIKELLDHRMPFYKNADIIIETDDRSPRQVADEIIEELKWKE